MYDYNVWANKEVINRLKELPKDIYHHEFQSGFSSISEVLTHIYLVEQLWFEIIAGRTMKDAFAQVNHIQSELESKDIEEIENLYATLSLQNKSLLNHHENMEQVIIVDNPYAGILETTIYESVLHIVTHGNYHRGNIATMLRQLGHPSVMQDYGLYLYKREDI
ncbi:MAG: DinB family protein [Heyndrickxia sp.]